jgi:type VI secretion system lysozyme-like protein
LRRNYRLGRVSDKKDGPTEDEKGIFFYRFVGPSKKIAGSKCLLGSTAASVIAEVTLLLNTRAAFDFNQLNEGSRRCVLGYGLQDFIHLSPRSKQDAQVLADAIYKSISAHEPRLVLESVIVETPRPSRDAVTALITGYISRSENSQEPLTFSVVVGAAS